MIPRRSIPRDRQALSTKAKANIIFAKAIERELPRLSKRSMGRTMVGASRSHAGTFACIATDQIHSAQLD